MGDRLNIVGQVDTSRIACLLSAVPQEEDAMELTRVPPSKVPDAPARLTSPESSTHSWRLLLHYLSSSRVDSDPPSLRNRYIGEPGHGDLSLQLWH